MHKLALVIGFNNRNHFTSVVGTRKEDIPAMMTSHLPVIFMDELDDTTGLVEASANIKIPYNSLQAF